MTTARESEAVLHDSHAGDPQHNRLARATTSHSMISDENRYTQVGENFRYYLTWREKLFAGFMVINAALAVAFTCIQQQKQDAQEQSAATTSFSAPALKRELSWRNPELASTRS